MLPSIALIGAGSFGAVVGWLVYYINRYRKGDVQLGDLTTIVGVVGGAAVTSLFGGGDKALFGAYGLGLLVGFFAYFAALIVLVRLSGGAFGPAWFLDGRRRDPAAGESIPGTAAPTFRPMVMQPTLDARVAALEDRLDRVEAAQRAAAPH